MTPPSRDQVLAASAGWVAVLLNVVPGLGAGYLYQRRWRAYWITSAVATAWFVAGAVLAQDAEAAAEAQNQLVGLIGLLVLAGVTATEAGLELKRVRQTNAGSALQRHALVAQQRGMQQIEHSIDPFGLRLGNRQHQCEHIQVTTFLG